MTSAVQTTRMFLPSPLKLGCSEPKSGFSGLTGHTILPAKFTTTSNAAPQALHTKRRVGVDVGDVAMESSRMKIVIQRRLATSLCQKSMLGNGRGAAVHPK
jgi:hypothetical protein